MADRVLIVDGNQTAHDSVTRKLGSRGLDLVVCADIDRALKETYDGDFDVIVANHRTGGLDGVALCERMASVCSSIPTIVVTASGNADTAVAALRAGAYDILSNPFETVVLLHAIKRAIAHRRLGEEVKSLRQRVNRIDTFGDIKGGSLAMQKVQRRIGKAAKANVNVLITGEGGTGKKRVARTLHHLSERSAGPFVSVNCAGMPDTLLESELFGSGTAAGANNGFGDRGRLTAASDGTLFLEEIGEIPRGLQVKLLRAIDEKVDRRDSARDGIGHAMRVVSTTRYDLTCSVAEGTFREDLYYRLNVVQIHLPPLRERGRDILLLAQYFIDQFAREMGSGVAGLTAAAAEKLMVYPWPGNVRELKNCMEHAIALTASEKITLSDLPERVRRFEPSDLWVAGFNAHDLVPMEEIERQYIARVLGAVKNNKALAARILKFDRKTLYRKLERYRLSEKDDASFNGDVEEAMS